MASKISIAITAKNQASGPIAQVQRSLSNLQSQANKSARVGGKINALGSSIVAGLGSNRGAISEIASFVGKAGIIGGVTALTVKLAQLESQWASSVRSMSNLAVRSGLSTTSAYGVQYAGRLAGLSAEQANGGIEQVRQTYSDAINNRNPEALKRFQAAGISTDPNRLESIESVLTKLAAYSEALRGQGKYGGAQNFLNAAGAGSLVDFLNRGPAQVAADLATAKAYIPNEQDVQRAKEYAEASAKLSITYDRLSTTIFNRLEPGMNALLEDMQRFLDTPARRDLMPKPPGAESSGYHIGDGFEAFGNKIRGRGAVTMAQLGQRTSVGSVWNLQQARDMVGWYMDHGVDRSFAIAMAANASRESSLDPRAQNASGHVGYFQWDKGRQGIYERTFGRPLSLATPEEQMGYSLWEMKNTESKAFQSIVDAQDVGDKAARISSLYERHGDPAEDQRRAALARQLDSELGGGGQADQSKVRVEIVHKNAPPGTSTNVTSSPNVDTQLRTDRQQAPLGDQYAYSPGNF